ncbi:unnamed protein product [Leptosia nina]|uniref:Peptidase M14 domain-containing protein n=1 Tax=Leptosia nina TaxID=320188 RepID=A0AAV1IXE9_9NEOP
MDLKILAISLIYLFHVSASKHEKYTGYTLYNVEILSQEDNEYIKGLGDLLELDVWQFGSPLAARDATIMVPPHNHDLFTKALIDRGLKYSVKEADVVRALSSFESDCSRWSKGRNNVQQPFTYYARLAEINAYMERLAQQYPNIVTLVNAGLSTEGRPINYLKISNSNFEDPTKPIYFFDTTMHAREWVTTPVALYAVHKLVENLEEADRDLLENIDWIILPVLNPDGYEFSHTDDRMWRKNRSLNATLSECYGVDLNRNFDIFFGDMNASKDPCSGAYHGSGPFSEIESRHLRDILHTYLDRIQTYVNIHSFGNYVLYGFDNATLPVNVAQIHHVGALMGAHIDSLKLPVAYHYAVGNSKFVLYPASGTSQDYAQNLGVPFSLTLELPDFRYGFLVPPEYIPQINRETWAGIAASARASVLFYRNRI